MSKPWDHLPNANHIDRFVASWNQHRGIWDSAWCKWRDLISDELQDQAYYEARAKCKELDRWDIWCDLRIPNNDAILALIAYDCAHYLEYTSQELTTIALLGVTPAILLLEAVLAFEALKNSSVVTE